MRYEIMYMLISLLSSEFVISEDFFSKHNSQKEIVIFRRVVLET